MAAALGVLLGGSGELYGVERHWNTGTGQWGISSNWSPFGVPTASDIVHVDHLVGGVRGVAIVTGTGHASPISVHVTNLNTLRLGGLATDSGQLSVGGDMIVGFTDGVGILEVNSSSPGIVFYNGRLTVGNTMRLGMNSGLGIVNQNDGTVTVNQLLRVGDRHNISPIFPGVGDYNLSGFGRLIAARLDVGYGFDGSFQYAVEGEFNLSGNAVLTVAPNAEGHDIQIGGSGGVGVFNQSGGTFISQHRLIDMARGGNGSGVYNYSGGVLNVPGFAFSNNNGTLNYTAGANLTTGQLQMAGGNVLLTSGANKTLRTTVLWVTSNSAVIDLNDNAMSILSTVTTLGGQSVPTLIRRGYNGGAWTGNGITSTAARLDPQQRTGLGFAIASDVLQDNGGGFIFRGQAVPANAILIKYTLYGDADLDGDVDGIDVGRWAQNFTGDLGGAGTMSWSKGDWDYDGDVDGIDVGLWAQNFTGELGGSGLAGMVLELPGIHPDAADLLAELGIAVVPEPATAGLLCGGLLLRALRARCRLAA